MKRMPLQTSKAAFIAVLIAGLTSMSCQDSTSNFNEFDGSLSNSQSQLTSTPGKKDVPPGLIKNTVKYADSSMPAASGKDGAVTVTAFAMIDAEGNTDLEITTGDFNNPESAHGMFTKLQIKALNLETPNIDEPVWVDNQNKLSTGHFSTNYSGLSRGQQLYVHSNVRGVTKGTAVVFMNEFIKARPDLEVTEIGANTNEAVVGEAVTIYATVTEKNGDLGANATCALYIDSEFVDSANNIWVDSGDVVTCEFETTFDTIGEKHIVVKAENVTPGDYDSSNNDAYYSLNVVESTVGGPNQFSWASGLFMSTDYYYERRRSDGSFDINEHSNRLFYWSGSKQNVSAFAMPETITARFQFSDESVVEGTYPLQARQITETSWSAMISNQYRSANNMFWLSSNVSFSSGTISINFSMNSTRTTYYGRSTYGGDYYFESSYGPKMEIGDEISFQVQVGPHSASGSYPINKRTNEYVINYGPNDYYIYRNTYYDGIHYGQPGVN